MIEVECSLFIREVLKEVCNFMSLIYIVYQLVFQATSLVSYLYSLILIRCHVRKRQSSNCFTFHALNVCV